ncbi:MAG: UDP-N-acetylmuramate dehydrogenase [Clostridiales bacterium]|nr:UDP-N-acetylmuramate dehydrogenase [Clostridiales bacterium]
MLHLTNAPIAQYSTFNIGGIAKDIYIPQNIDELIDIATTYPNAIILGNGSKILFPDSPLTTPLILTNHLKNISVTNNTITADCGVHLAKLNQVALKYSLTGLEFSYGIPGRLGGAIFMNAGAHGGEFADIIHSVTYLKNGKVMSTTSPSFSYRSSQFKTDGGIILQATLKLSNGNANDIKAKMSQLIALRVASQPLNHPNCGSTFKRINGEAVYKYIDGVNMRGVKCGGAQVSTKHSGFIVNLGGATARDVTTLVKTIKQKVKDKYNINLQEEMITIS